MNNFKNTIISLSLIFFSFNLLAGGGWPQKKGEGYFKFGQGMIRANRYYTPDGSFAKITTTSYYVSFLYGEYGLTDRFTAVTYLPFLARVTQNRVIDANTKDEIVPGDELTSFGDATFGLKYGIIPKGKVVWSAQADFKFPFGNDKGGKSGILQTGDGAYSQALKTEVSTTKGSFYFTGMMGIRHRGGAYSDDWQAGMEVGWNKNRRFYAIVKLNSNQSFFNKKENIGANNSLFGNNIEYIGFGPELHYFFKNNWGVNATIRGSLQGRNVLANPYIGLGISYDLKKKKA